MKKLFSSQGLFVLGFILLIAANIAVFTGVAFNRSGEDETQIMLTERELKLPYRSRKENSGLALHLTWRTLGKKEEGSGYSDGKSPAWLDPEKLEKLGFNINAFPSSDKNTVFHRKLFPKEVFIVLENDGEAYREAMERAEAALEKEKNALKLNPGDKRLQNNFERAEMQLKHEQVNRTRLFAIDAGLEAGELRKRYGDRTRFIITKGLVKPKFGSYKNNKEVSGFITGLSVESISVPLEHRQIFESILARKYSEKKDPDAPRFEVKLAYGSRLEPWIISVRTLDDKS